MLGRRIIPGPDGLAELCVVLGIDYTGQVTERFLFGINRTGKFRDSLNDTSSDQGEADTARRVKFFFGIFQAELQERSPFFRSEERLSHAAFGNGHVLRHTAVMGSGMGQEGESNAAVRGSESGLNFNSRCEPIPSSGGMP
jgi:hypothetical protein